MNLIVTNTMAAEAAGFIAEQVRTKPNSVLGLATGSTPIVIYEALVQMYRDDGLSFKDVVTFNLDEYFPMAPGDPQSYVRFMFQHFFDHVDINKANVHIPDGTLSVENIPTYCEKYERAIEEAGGIDLQLLGIGGNGHVAFNEPQSAFDSRTRRVDLTEKTISDNSRFFASLSHVPTSALTMGIETIMSARRILVVANGTAKAIAVKAAIDGLVTPACPASVLQLHPSVTYILDPPAAALVGSTQVPSPSMMTSTEASIRAVVSIAAHAAPAA